MRCIQLQCRSPFSPFNFFQNYYHQEPNITKMCSFAYNVRNRNNNDYMSYKQKSCPLKTKAMSNFLVIGITSSARPVDPTVLAVTSAVFLFVYWIANFVVPGIIIKDLQSETKTSNDDQKIYDDDD